VTVDARPGGDCCGWVTLPLPGFDGYIGLLAPDSGDLERDVAAAAFSLAHLIALANQEDYGATLDHDLDHFSIGVRSWDCSQRCELWRERTLLADCMAGAAMRWALSRGRIRPSTVQRMRELIRGLRPDSPATGRAAPSGWLRERWFLRGLRSSQRTANPFDACWPPTA
jgi:hypothetical protein